MGGETFFPVLTDLKSGGGGNRSLSCVLQTPVTLQIDCLEEFRKEAHEEDCRRFGLLRGTP